MGDNRRQAMLKLDFIIVGGGLSGLATAHALASSGHRVRVFEKSPTGNGSRAGGFRITPNGYKVLQQWGALDEFTMRGWKMPSTEYYDMETGESIGYLGWKEEVLRELGGEFYTISHHDLHDILHDLAVKSGAEIMNDTAVTSFLPPLEDSAAKSSSSSSNPEYDPSKPTIVLSTGDSFQADIIIGADGGHSLVRQVIEQVPKLPTTNTVVYSATIPSDKMQDDAGLKEVTEIGHNIWMGNRCCVMAYPVCNKKAWVFTFWQNEELNDKDPVGWGTPIPSSCLKYDKLDPRLRTAITNIQTLERVTTGYLPYAESWVDKSETIVLIGEAAHPFPPCGMPSATIVLEEASFLGTLFSHLRGRTQIASFLYTFEDLRRPRTHTLHAAELDNITIFSLPPGPERKARDDVWREQKKAYVNREIGKGSGSTSGSARGSGEGEHDLADTNSEAENQELLRQWQELFEIWGYDARDAAESWWVEWGILSERALNMDMGNVTELHARYETEVSRCRNTLGIHNVEVVAPHS